MTSAMCAFEDRYPDWSDFPNGLQVLLVDEDVKILNEYKCKLEECKYAVTALTSGAEAIKVLHSQEHTFHVALVEAMTGEGSEGLRLLKEMAKHLPVVLMSNTHNMALMMRGIAMGAADFLQKPLSDEKLRNIWTHVMRKAVDRGDLAVMETLAPTKAAAAAVFHVATPRDVHGTGRRTSFRTDNAVEWCGKREGQGDTEVVRAAKLRRMDNGKLGEMRGAYPGTPPEELGKAEGAEEASSRSDSPGQTQEDLASQLILPKIEWGDEEVLCQHEELAGLALVMPEMKTSPMCDTEVRQVGKVTLQDQTRVKAEPDDQGYESVVLDDEEVGTDLDPCSLLSVPNEVLDFPIEGLDGGEVHDNEFSVEDEAVMLAMIKGDDGDDERSASGGILGPSCGEEGNEGHGHDNEEPSGKNGKTAGRRKMKVDWTPELHRRFVQAVEQLGVEKAIPSRILELMGVECLTRHNIASHLQKYRSHRRHLIAKEAEAATWHHRRPSDPAVWTRMRRDGTPWVAHHATPSPIQPRPPLGLPPIQPHPMPPPQPSTGHHPVVPLHVWGHPTMEPSAPHVWQQPMALHVPPLWHTPDGAMWGQHPVPHADAWGHGPAPGTPCYPHPQSMMRLPIGPPHVGAFYPSTTPAVGTAMQLTAAHPQGPENTFVDEAMPLPMYHFLDDLDLTGKPLELHPPMDVLEATINEALSNPHTAQLPLGLKSPSMEGVMAELHKRSVRKEGQPK